MASLPGWNGPGNFRVIKQSDELHKHYPCGLIYYDGMGLKNERCGKSRIFRMPLGLIIDFFWGITIPVYPLTDAGLMNQKDNTYA